MTLNILFAARPDQWAEYETPMTRALTDALANAGRSFDLRTDHTPAEVDYIVYAPDGPVTDFTPFARLKAVLSLWAGVEAVVGNPTLTVPLTRMVDFGLRQGMMEWVTGHVLRHHLGMDAHILAQPGEWAPAAPPLSRDRRVTILGMGALGQACAAMLVRLGFDVAGWSRTAKPVAGIGMYSGRKGLQAALALADILVLLLPDTPQTENTLNAETLAWMPRGAVIINPGRGTLIDDTALLGALDSGQISHATLDVFRVEPLPGGHPYWAHPRVTVTPHIASETRADSSSEVIAENIRRNEAGQAMMHLVDMARGY